MTKEEKSQDSYVTDPQSLAWKHYDKVMTCIGNASPETPYLNIAEQILRALSRFIQRDKKYEGEIKRLDEEKTKQLEKLTPKEQKEQSFELKLDYTLKHLTALSELMERRGYYPHIPEEAIVFDPRKLKGKLKENGTFD